MKREYRLSGSCAEPGCRETFFQIHETRADYAKAELSLARNPWRCWRHNGRHLVLSPTARRSRSETVTVQKDYGRFFGGRHGIIFGQGFVAHADDFPPGTRLVVTAEIVLPDESDDAPEPGS